MGNIWKNKKQIVTNEENSLIMPNIHQKVSVTQDSFCLVSNWAHEPWKTSRCFRFHRQVPHQKLDMLFCHACLLSLCASLEELVAEIFAQLSWGCF